MKENDLNLPLIHIPNQLVGVFQDEKSAKEAAGLYGIELESFRYEVAVFNCADKPDSYIETGKENGWPELYLNYTYRAF